MLHPSEDDLALVALGEQLPDTAQHLLGCAACAEQVAELRYVVQTARDADPTDCAPAPPRVWDRICHELDLSRAGSQVPAPRVPAAPTWAHPPATAPVPASRGRLRRRLATAGLALAAGVTGVLGAGLLGADQPASKVAATSTLVALGASPADGQAVLTGDRSLVVSTQGLPPTTGAYEVWLLEPGTGQMVALGLLGDDGAARLAVPAGVAAGDYPVIDVSDEPADGDPTHSGDSVLRGASPV